MTDSRASVQEVMAALRGLSTEIDRLDQLAAVLHGLNRTDQRALDLVVRHAGLAPTDLAAALGLTTGGVTTVIDRLERAGYVQRKADPSDRRRISVEPTKQTALRDDEIFGQLIARAEAVIGTYSANERLVIQDFLVRIREAIAAHADAQRQAAAPAGS